MEPSAESVSEPHGVGPVRRTPAEAMEQAEKAPPDYRTYKSCLFAPAPPADVVPYRTPPERIGVPTGFCPSVDPLKEWRTDSLPFVSDVIIAPYPNPPPPSVTPYRFVPEATSEPRGIAPSPTRAPKLWSTFDLAAQVRREESAQAAYAAEVPRPGLPAAADMP